MRQKSLFAVAKFACCLLGACTIGVDPETVDSDVAAQALRASPEELANGVDVESGSALARQNNGGSSPNPTCVSKLQNCYLDCRDKHPADDSASQVWREQCEDVCDVVYDRCEGKSGARDDFGNALDDLSAIDPGVAAAE